jgi:lipoprotein-anchoring transpeptidase ErfK/SrfK
MNALRNWARPGIRLRVAMTILRILGAVLAAALATFSMPAQAQFPTLDLQSRYEMIDRDTGRSIGPVHRRGLIGGSPIPRTTVQFDGRKYAPGSIIVNTKERRLYYVQSEASAIRYGIGVGRDGFRWGGVHKVTQKREWPGWTPPEQMRKRQPGLPAYMPGGPDNPLGARALYLGSTLYRIHGSNEPETIGEAVSSGCFRMTNEDVIDLYERVKVGAVVHVLH